MLDDQLAVLSAEFQFAGVTTPISIVEEGVEFPLLDATRDRLFLALLQAMMQLAEDTYRSKYAPDV